MPFNAESTMTKAAVAKVMLNIEMVEITLMKPLFFLDRKYLLAIKKAAFTVYGAVSSFGAGGMFKSSITLLM